MTPNGSARIGRHLKSPVVWGVAGAILTLVCLGAIITLAIPPILPVDENAHAAYALDVSDGRLPNMENGIEIRVTGQRHGLQHVGNHPPLYYLLIAPTMGWGDDSGHELTGIWASRMISVLLTAGTVVLVAYFAGVLVRRRRREAMVLAAGLTATAPFFVMISSLIHNDALAVLTGTGVFTAGVVALVRGPRPWVITAACATAGLTMLTRFNGIVLVAIACFGVAVATLARTRGSALARLGRAALFSGLPVLSAALVSGWFYLRNRRLYGDVTGLEFIIDRLRRDQSKTFWDTFLDPDAALDMLVKAENGGYRWDDTPFLGDFGFSIFLVVLGVIAVGGVLAVGRRVVEWYSSRESRPRLESSDRLCRLGLVAMFVGLPLALWIQLARFVDIGGSAHARYVFPAVALVAAGVALACLGFRGRLGSVLGMAVIVTQLFFTLHTTSRWLGSRSPYLDDEPGWWQGLYDALELADIPSVGLVLGMLVAGALVGAALQAAALWRLSGPAGRPADGADEPAASGDVPAPLASRQLEVVGNSLTAGTSGAALGR